MERIAAADSCPDPRIAELQSMGFHPAACSRALQLTNNSLSRAIDWLLSNPDEAAAAASGAPFSAGIMSMGFDLPLVRQALEQTGGDEQRAITLILNGQVVREGASRESSPPPLLPFPPHGGPLHPPFPPPLPSGDSRAIFSMGFPVDQVRLALRRSRDNEVRAIELLLSGPIADGEDEEESPIAQISRRSSGCPAEWSGSIEDFERIMDQSMQLYFSWCSNARSGGVRPNREHHERWVIQQLCECREAFDHRHLTSESSAVGASSTSPTLPLTAHSQSFASSDVSSHGNYNIMQHAEFMISSFRARHPGLRMMASFFGSRMSLQVDRDDIVNSTVAALTAIPDDKVSDNISIRFNGQSGTDAGGLTDDWLSLFMQEALDPYRNPPLFLLPWQAEGEASCLRLNHSMLAFGISEQQQQSIMRAFGIVLGICMKKGRYACNTYTLSKSLLQRLLKQDLPAGILPLSEEFPDAFRHLNSLMQRREVWGADSSGTGQSLAEYLSAAEQKYTAESKVADLITLQQFLQLRIEIESSLVETYEPESPLAAQQLSASAVARAGQSSEVQHARSALLMAIIQRETVVKKIKAAFKEENSKRPLHDQFAVPRGSEIRQKMREFSGAPSALAAGVAVPTPDTWQLRKVALQELIEKRRVLIARFDQAKDVLVKMRRQQSGSMFQDDVMASALPSELSPTTDLSPENFDSYCEDLVRKRLHNDVVPLIDAMRSGFNLIQPDDATLRSIDAAQVQHKLFPLSPVTLAEFQSSARVSVASQSTDLLNNRDLLWRVMAEELNEEQIQNVFYFATNFHTLAGADRNVKIVFESRRPGDLLPRASTCSWTLKLPDCIVPGDKAPDYPMSRARMRAVLTWASAPEAQGYGFS